MAKIFNSRLLTFQTSLLKKSFFGISLFFLTSFVLLSCSKDEEDPINPSRIVLSSSKTTIAANGIDEVAFEVSVFDRKNTLMTNVNYGLYVNDELIESDVFSTNQTGEYTFYAQAEGLRSNDVFIKAIQPQNALVASVNLDADNKLIIADGVSTSNLSISFHDLNGNILTDVDYSILANGMVYESQKFKTTKSGKYELRVKVNDLESDKIDIEARPKMDYDEISIPIIFHIVHSGEAVGTGSNISGTSVSSILNNLNKAFSNGFGSQNSNAVDTHIRFRLAALDENNNKLAEPGLDRINGKEYDVGSQDRGNEDEGLIYGPVIDKTFNNSAALNLGTEDLADDGHFGYHEMEAMGEKLNWDRKQYYNIYIVPIQDNISAGGFAYYPFLIEPMSIEGISSLTGTAENNLPNVAPCVIDYEQAISESSTTVIHEIGHTFGLFHVFSKDECLTSDYCKDTYSYLNGHRDQPCSDNKVGDERDNFMDYISNRSTFTYDQRERMRTILEYGFFYKDLKNSEK